MTVIAHISDLHFGAAATRAVDALRVSLEEQQPDLVVVTGDITQEGRKREFEEARSFLVSLPGRVFVVPGNHDVPVRNLWARFTAPYDRFGRFVNPDINPIYSSSRLKLVGLNSARRAAVDVNWSYGRLSRTQIENAAAQLNAATPAAIKAVAVHHPFIKGPGRAGARTVGRGAEALSAFAEAGLDFALTGHVHRSKAEVHAVGSRNIVLVQAGTATSVRTRHEPPAYNLVLAQTNKLTVSVFGFGDNQFDLQHETRFQASNESGWFQTS